MRKNSNIFQAKRDLSAYRPTDAIRNHKRVEPLLKINVRTSAKGNLNSKIEKRFFDSKVCI